MMNLPSAIEHVHFVWQNTNCRFIFWHFLKFLLFSAAIALLIKCLYVMQRAFGTHRLFPCYSLKRIDFCLEWWNRGYWTNKVLYNEDVSHVTSMLALDWGIFLKISMCVSCTILPGTSTSMVNNDKAAVSF